MKYIQCPDDYTTIDKPTYIWAKLFLAGGITGCDDWQSYVVNHITASDLAVINPRRQVWDSSITTEEQVTWEFKATQKCNHILFWFTPPTMNPKFVRLLMIILVVLSVFKNIKKGKTWQKKKKQSTSIQVDLVHIGVW